MTTGGLTDLPMLNMGFDFRPVVADEPTPAAAGSVRRNEPMRLVRSGLVRLVGARPPVAVSDPSGVSGPAAPVSAGLAARRNALKVGLAVVPFTAASDRARRQRQRPCDAGR